MIISGMEIDMQSEPLACDTSALDPSQWERHREVVEGLIEAVDSVEEVPHGLRLRLCTDSSALALAAEFISRERVCCPFLTFGLTAPAGAAVELEITGPQGTRKLLREALAL